MDPYNLIFQNLTDMGALISVAAGNEYSGEFLVEIV